MSDKFIKTQCGLEKYTQLAKKRGIFSRIRFFWFVIFASLRDFAAAVGTKNKN